MARFQPTINDKEIRSKKSSKFDDLRKEVRVFRTYSTVVSNSFSRPADVGILQHLLYQFCL